MAPNNDGNVLILPTILLLVICSSLLPQAQGACISLDDCPECDYGYSTDKDGCQTCQCQSSICQSTDCELGTVCKEFLLSFSMHKVARCIDPTTPPHCHYPMDPGPCDTINEEKYFYNQKTGLCKTFIYGGCKGNRNNFMTLEECEMGCKTGMCEGLVTCDLFCEHGRVRDANGCELCECTEPEEGMTSCPDIQRTCKMFCRNGFKRDLEGCEFCECRPEIPVCPDIMCQMHCEAGFLKDREGCDVCKCADDVRVLAANGDTDSFNECPEVLCKMHCEHGYVMDDNGCPQCMCERITCELLIKCELFCEFGHVLDNTGCPTCECLANPCKESPITCQDPYVCQPTINRSGNWHAECKDPAMIEDERPWCKHRFLCDLYCPHSFYTNKYGCDICKCRSSEKETCEKQECSRSCEFGYRYDENSCSTCDCLVDPCDDIVCTAVQVCEQKKFCKMCPVIGFCLSEKLVRRIKILLTYSHPAIKDLDTREFEDAVENSISQLMSVDDEYVRGISIRTPMQDATTVEMHVVTYGNLDLVEAFEKLKTYIRDQPEYASIFFNGLNFEPSASSVEVDYSSDPDFEIQELSETEDEEDDDTMMIIIIVCVVVAVVAIAAATVITVIVCRNKKAKKAEINRLSISYHQAATGDNNAQP